MTAGARNAAQGAARPSRAERAYETIRARIESNTYPPGFTALETELAEALEVSRTPVREALVRLQDEGYVEIRPRHGMRVLGLSPDDMREIYEVVAGLEAMAVLLIARADDRSDVVARLSAAVDAMERALDIDDLSAWAEADGWFHRCLFDSCGNRRMAKLGRAQLSRTERAKIFTLHLRRRPSISTTDHRRLVALIARGDAADAQAEVVRHRMTAMQELVAIIAKHRLVSV